MAAIDYSDLNALACQLIELAGARGMKRQCYQPSRTSRFKAFVSRVLSRRREHHPRLLASPDPTTRPR
jgi:hypothetical protein